MHRRTSLLQEPTARRLISFNARPVMDGSTITSYTRHSNDGQHSATGGSSPITVSGLTNGTGYTFTVTATNAVNGTSSVSGSQAIGRSGGGSWRADDRTATGQVTEQATITFTAPTNNGGLTITSYTVTSNDGLHSATAAPRQSQFLPRKWHDIHIHSDGDQWCRNKLRFSY